MTFLFHEMRRIYEYKSYREFLTDFYESRKRSSEKFTLRRFASMAGFHSAGFLKMILSGQRNLSHESIRKLATALELNKEETGHFTNLVLLNQATTTDEKKYYAEQLLRSREYRKLNPFKSAQYDFYTQWYCIVIRELVAFEEFVEDPAWIASAVEPPISAREAQAALDLLLELELIERGPGGRLAQTKRALTTGDEVDSASVSEFHRSMLQRAAESIDRFDSQERDISALTFGAGPKTARQVKELVQKFRKDLAEVLLASDEKAEEVYELGFQFFPLSRRARVLGKKRSKS
ncbi:MAG TPA: TIGR02147 family protein [Bdellovibrionota bacterium]|nr:TIGR02147 family protein [Bdellovibrionota bacterium]